MATLIKNRNNNNTINNNNNNNDNNNNNNTIYHQYWLTFCNRVWKKEWNITVVLNHTEGQHKQWHIPGRFVVTPAVLHGSGTTVIKAKLH